MSPAKNIPLPSVHDYLDYRIFLKDYYEARKTANPAFSYQVFANQGGLGSQNLVFLVMKGERNITSKSIGKFIKALGLNARERKYFESLVNFNQAKDIELKKYHYEQILPLYKKFHGRTLEEGQYRYLSNWSVPVIREMMMHEDFIADPKLIAKKLKNKVGVKEVKEALNLLLELGLAKKDPNGRFRVTEVSVKTPDVVADVAAFDYHNQMIDRAKESLTDCIDNDQAELAGVTATITREQYESLRLAIRDFKNEIINRLREVKEGPKDVYQLNVQFFSLTKCREDQ